MNDAMRNMLRVVCFVLVAIGFALMFTTAPNDRNAQQIGVFLVLGFGLCGLALFVKRAI